MSRRAKQLYKFLNGIALLTGVGLYGSAGLQTVLAEELQLSLLTESEYLGEVPTIMTASRMPQLQSEAPAAVTVIDAEMIRASGVRNIVDLMRFVPGFQIGNYNSAHPVATYHGLSDQFPRNMQVLVDGRSVYSPMFRGAFWADLTVDIDDIERIEVIRGPNSVTYGSNAFFGVINIVTRHASQQNGTYLKGVAGNNGIRDATIRHAWRVGDQSFRVTGGWREDSGIESRDDDVEAAFVNFTGDLRLNQNNVLEIDVGVNKNRYIEDYIDASVSVLPATREVTSSYEQVRWRNAAGQSQEISVQLFHNYRDQKQETIATSDAFIDVLGLIEAPLNNNATEDRYDFEFQHNVRVSSAFQLVWGVGARRDEMQSELYFADNLVRKNRVNRLYSNIEWHATQKLVLNAGAIYEDSDVAGDDVSPRIAANYHVTPSDTIRISVSKATRMPALIEQEGNQRYAFNHEVFGELLFDQAISSAGGLVTEKITTQEIAYLARISALDLSWGLRLYRDSITDRISEIIVPAIELSPEGEAFSFVNNGEIEVSGLELELDYQPSDKWRILFNGARMEVETSQFNPEYDLVPPTPVVERSVPDYSINATINYRFLREWQAGLMAGRVSGMEWLGDGTYVHGQNRIDLNVFREFHSANSTSRLALSVQWAGGEYIDFRTDNVVDTRYFLTFDTQF